MNPRNRLRTILTHLSTLAEAVTWAAATAVVSTSILGDTLTGRSLLSSIVVTVLAEWARAQG
jgi:hypothetical protein